MIKCDKPNILCEVVKEAEDGDSLIFRLFECNNSKTVANISFGFDAESVELCDMNEEVIEKLPLVDGRVELTFGAFEIHTIKVK